MRLRDLVLSPMAAFCVAVFLPLVLDYASIPVVYAQAPVAVVADGVATPPSELTRVAGQTLSAIEGRLGMRLRNGGITVRVCGNDAAYRRAGGLGNTDACYLCPDKIVLRRPSGMTGDLAHEFAHVLIHEKTRARCPAWLEEGVVNHENHIVGSGQYTEREISRLDAALSEVAAGDRGWSLQSLSEEAQESRFMGDAFYGASWSATDYLYREYGRDAVLACLGDMAAHGVNRAFERRFGMGLAAFEARWKASLSEKGARVVAGGTDAHGG